MMFVRKKLPQQVVSNSSPCSFVYSCCSYEEENVYVTFEKFVFKIEGIHTLSMVTLICMFFHSISFSF